MSKKIELARKLHALAQRGVGGEKANAEQLLAKLLTDTGLTLEDIERTDRELVFLKSTKAQQWLMVQCVYLVLGSKANPCGVINKRYWVCVEATNAEHLEILAAFDVYWNLYLEELEVFKLAFLSRNRVWSQDDDSSSSNKKPMTPERERMLRKAAIMASSIDKVTHHKRLK